MGRDCVSCTVQMMMKSEEKRSLNGEDAEGGECGKREAMEIKSMSSLFTSAFIPKSFHQYLFLFSFPLDSVHSLFLFSARTSMLVVIAVNVVVVIVVSHSIAFWCCLSNVCTTY